MLKIVLLLALMSPKIFASAFVEGTGNFYASDDDSLSFVKEQLIHQGFRDIVNKELIAMGLDAELFWGKREEAISNAMAGVESGLRQKHKMDEDPSAQQRTNFQRELRQRELSMRRGFSGLHSVVQSYSIKKMSRSAQDPNSRFISLEAKVDRDRLAKIYYDLVRGKKSSAFGALYIHVDYNLKDMSFSDLGVTNDRDFTDVVNNYWLKWFSENKPQNIANVEILDADKLKRLQDYFKLPYEKMLTEIPELFVNSLYLRIEINIEKVKKDAEFNEYVFAYDGGMFLQDLQNQQILSSHQFDREVKSYPLVEKENVSSLVANYVYRMPFARFAKLNDAIKAIPPMNGIQRVGLFDYSNIEDVYSLMDLISSRGIKFSLKPRLESIGNNKAELVLFYDGDLPELKALLHGLKSAKSSLSFDVIDADEALGIKFNKLEDQGQET